MEWLLTHSSNSDMDTPLSIEEDEENEETEKQQLVRTRCT